MGSTKIGITLKDARCVNYMTQAELGKKAGLSREYIARVENGRIIPSSKAMSKIIAALPEERGVLVHAIYEDQRERLHENMKKLLTKK